MDSPRYAGTIEVGADRTRLWVEIYGTGPPCIWIHGGAGNMDHRSWLPWVLPLAEEYSLILYDQRGNGRSIAAEPDSCRLETLAGDLEALRRAMGLEGPAIMGHSAGGFVALLHALRYPGTTRGVAVIGTAATHQFIDSARSTVAKRGNESMVAAFERLWGSSGITDDDDYRLCWQTILPMYFADRSLIPEIPHDLPFSIRVRRSVGRDVAQFDITSRMKEIRVPVLVAVGRHDWVCPIEEAELLANGLAASTLHVFERSGHFPFIEEQASFLAMMRSFLRRHLTCDKGD